MQKKLLVFSIFFIWLISFPSLVAAESLQEKFEDELIKKINKITFSVFNDTSYNYHAEAMVGEKKEAVLCIKDVIAGAYHSRSQGYSLDPITGKQRLIAEGTAEVVIKKGKNLVEITLIPLEYQWVQLALSGEHTGRETVFQVEGKKKNGSFKTIGSLSEDKKFIWVSISTSTTEMSIIVGNKKYFLPIENVFQSIIDNSLLPLQSCSVENINSTEKINTVEANIKLLNCTQVPQQFTSIQEAINAATTCVKVNPGFYKEQIIQKAGIKIIGNASNPMSVEISSDQPFTLKGDPSGGQGELIGITISNTYLGDANDNTSAAVFYGQNWQPIIDHCIITNSGNSKVLITHSIPILTNTTIIGNGRNTGLAFFNGSGNQAILKFLLLVNLEIAVSADDYPVNIRNSLFWKAEPGKIWSFSSNVFGDPELIGKAAPSKLSIAIQRSIALSEGNYPGAILPINPPLTF